MEIWLFVHCNVLEIFKWRSPIVHLRRFYGKQRTLSVWLVVLGQRIEAASKPDAALRTEPRYFPVVACRIILVLEHRSLIDNHSHKSPRNWNIEVQWRIKLRHSIFLPLLYSKMCIRIFLLSFYSKLYSTLSLVI